MPLTAEQKEYADELGMNEEEFLAAFPEERFNKLKGGYGKNKDYTTKTQALAEERRRFQQEQQEWAQGRDYTDRQNAAWKEDVEKRLNSALEQVSQSRLYGAALESKLQAVAAEYGLEFEDLVKDVKERREEPKKAAEPDYKPYDERYVDRDSFRKTTDTMFAYSSMLRDFEREYKKLYGKEYDGEITELVGNASKEVQARQGRGVNADLWTVMREQLDFSGQKARNDEAAKAAAEKEKEEWRKQTREEIDRDLRTQYAVSNPNAGRQPDKANEWRNNLSATKRQQQQDRKATPMDNFQRRQEIHRAYEERAAKHEAA